MPPLLHPIIHVFHPKPVSWRPLSRPSGRLCLACHHYPAGPPSQGTKANALRVVHWGWWATNLTVRSIRKAMSTLVEHHLWLNLAEMKDVDKVRFIDAPISQAGLFGDTVEGFAQQFSVVQKQTEAIQHILPWHDAPPFTVAPRARPQFLPRTESTPRPTPACQPAPKWSRKTTNRPWHGLPRDVGIWTYSGDGEDSVTPSPEEGQAENLCFILFLLW